MRTCSSGMAVTLLSPTSAVSVLCAAPPRFSWQPISRNPWLSGHRACRAAVRCSAANKPSPPDSEVRYPPPCSPFRLAPSNSWLMSRSSHHHPGNLILPRCSSMARIRSEVLSPLRSVRMFFYLAFIASGSLGGLIALTQLLPARGATAASETLEGLGIDVAAVALFAFLYARERRAKDAQVARLAREERLSRLKLRVGADGGRPFPLGELRGTARLVVVAGPAEFVAESFRRSQPLLRELAERAVLAVPFVTDGGAPELRLEETSGEGEDDDVVARKSKRLWQLAPVYTAEWAEWLDEQKRLAGVAPDSPVYLSLRMDGRVRGSGVGYPPWQAFVAQLPPVKGMWSGLLDGMDGRVL
ncbi:hypothetical protein PR202_ga19744 [Eleusine coracana subsp. coracana]|uniref:Protein LOW PSII ACCUMULATION 1, chloroplastic n=1 Tax=Eleusine coracana subsp. coracana TaxID=191504 RepID=A0AAV5CV18_ELECO|nr:hypothetical protein PR202_ga19744 [Eleusine coracana subsp. coracana]